MQEDLSSSAGSGCRTSVLLELPLLESHRQKFFLMLYDEDRSDAPWGSFLLNLASFFQAAANSESSLGHVFQRC